MNYNIFTHEDMINLQNFLRTNNQTITTAESCTGGLASYMITKISGSSDIFNGSIVSYSNEIKEKELKVNNSTLIKYGAVSKETVSEMLDGVIEKFNSDYAIAISGIAGPTGGTKDKPVGTVIIGVSDKNNNKYIELYQFVGSREEVQIQAAQQSFKNFHNFFEKPLTK